MLYIRTTFKNVLSEKNFTQYNVIYKVDHFNQYMRLSRKGEIFSKNVSDKSFMISREKKTVILVDLDKKPRLRSGPCYIKIF